MWRGEKVSAEEQDVDKDGSLTSFQAVLDRRRGCSFFFLVLTNNPKERIQTARWNGVRSLATHYFLHQLENQSWSPPLGQSSAVAFCCRLLEQLKDFRTTRYWGSNRPIGQMCRRFGSSFPRLCFKIPSTFIRKNGQVTKNKNYIFDVFARKHAFWLLFWVNSILMKYHRVLGPVYSHFLLWL